MMWSLSPVRGEAPLRQVAAEFGISVPVWRTGLKPPMSNGGRPGEPKRNPRSYEK